ncbi:MAG TPA: D-glycero-beta-D-manno-heptose-7-phosphate kinase [Rhodospirillaceae bacterium]|nr:D-glycero-beta-D-manno-heptose-7-phosphate kinase [Rhodospirillaceae bacterium]
MTDQSALAARIPSLEGRSVLCVGDVMLDRFVYGEVERISPEAPIPVLRVLREVAMLGGAGNVVRNLVALGANPHFVAVVGDDLAAREVTRLVGEHAAVDPLLIVENDRQTTIKTRFFAGGQQLLRADQETLVLPGAGVQGQILKQVATLLAKVDLVVLSDYGKGVLTPTSLPALIALAKAAGRPVIVDPKGRDYAVYAGATLVTPNRKELQEATGMAVASTEEIVAAARKVMADCGIANVLVTRSQDGMSLVLEDGSTHHLPAEAREVFDVSGAGDTVVATMAAAMAGGLPLLDAARLANVAAGIVVGKVGTAVAYGSDLVAALHHSDLVAGEAKVLTADAAIEQLERWRLKGYRIGFTNGCFDLLHPGHVSLLEQAKAHCDRLVVGLNSDQSVKRLKGPSRPVQSEAARATVLSSLGSVDLVVVFDQDTPLDLITRLRPDLLVKGADYAVAQVVGADLVQGWGGKVILAQLAEGHSTTATIARMNQ